MSIEPWKRKVDLFRSRFVAREDRFLINKIMNVKDGENYVEKKMPMPACKNYGSQQVCRITRREGGCNGCEAQVYQSLTDEVIWKHISGEQELILLMNRAEGIRFGATDFDKGTVFEDAKAIKDLSTKLGVPCYVAKSTKKGYHVYWFFSDFVKPHEFTSYIRYLYEELGFYQRWHVTPAAGLPEVFPKQTAFADKDTGNGIKVPMAEPRMREGRNCWMEDDETPISFDKQWEFLEATQLTAPETFAKALVDNNVEILKAPASRDRQRARKLEGKEEGAAAKIKPYGDFWSIVEGCPAMQLYWSRDAKGNFIYDQQNPDPRGFIPYPAYWSSILLAVTTTNGIDEIKKRWPDQDTLAKVEDALARGYAPHSCVSMQTAGVCIRGKHPKYDDHCLKKLPPAEFIEGSRKVNPEGLPESQWPEPSPIRFAADRHLSGDDIIERLEHIFKGLKARAKALKNGKVCDEYLPPNPDERITSLLKGAWRLGEEEYQKVKSHITRNRLMTATELKAREKEFKKQDSSKKDDTQRRMSALSFKGLNGFEYFYQNGGYTRVWYDDKGLRKEMQFTNFHIAIHEEVVKLRVADGVDLASADAAEDRDFVGDIYVNNERIPYSVPAREWFASADAFFRMLTQLGGSKLQYVRADYDHIRNAVYGFSENKRVERKVSRQIGYHVLKGREVYIMPSVIVDKESIRPNDEFGVEQFADDVSKSLDFKILSEDEFKSLANHVIADYFTCNHKAVTMTTFAHAMAAVLLPFVEEVVGYNKSPVLWLGGSFSKGKSFVAAAAQNFFGNFKMLQNASGTAKSKVHNAYNFRHAFMLIDDYKKRLVDSFGVEMPLFIQLAYDRTGRTALNKDGTSRKKVDRVRGLICVSAEDALENEASAASRIIDVNVKLKENFETGARVKERREDYCGFTPYFIQFCLNLHPEEIRELWEKYHSDFNKTIPEKDRTAANRVCENLTLNMIAFRFTMDMLVAHGAIPEVQKDELCRIHTATLKEICENILTGVADATGAKVFLDSLKEIVTDTARYEVVGWPATALEERASNCAPIGFWSSKAPELIYFYPKKVHGLVCEMASKSRTSVQVASHIARQLYETGDLVIPEAIRKAGRFAVQVRNPEKVSIAAWPIRCEALGLEVPVVEKSKKRRESGGNQSGLALISDEPEE